MQATTPERPPILTLEEVLRILGAQIIFDDDNNFTANVGLSKIIGDTESAAIQFHEDNWVVFPKKPAYPIIIVRLPSGDIQVYKASKGECLSAIYSALPGSIAAWLSKFINWV